MYSVEDGEEFVFIGLNTSDYFDKQIFAIPHELYHYFTKTKSLLSSSFDDVDDITELKANRFAAEFLFPEDSIKRSIIDEFKTLKLYNLSEKAILRFIARLQCTWWLPYRSLVRRLHEIAAINDEQNEKL